MEQHANQQYEFGHFRLMPNERRLYRENESVALPPKEFELLFLLVRNAGQPMTREDLHRTLWPHSIVEEANLNVHISALRKALADGSTEAQFIETLPRHGYRFVAPVTAVELPDSIIKQVAAVPTEIKLLSDDDAVSSKSEVAPKRFWQYARQRPALWIAILCVLALTLLGSLAGLYLYLFKAPNAEGATGNDSFAVNTLPLTTYPGRETQSAFSPDGNQLAFVWSKEDTANLDIYLRMVEGGNVIQLTNHAGDESNPTWGPQGRALAFYRSANDGDGIFVIPALGGTERKLTEVSPHRTGLGPHTWLHWSSTGKWLVITDKATGQEPLSLYLLSPETGEKRRLTTPPVSVIGDCSPMFSPDGSQIAFVRLLSAAAGELFIVSVNDGEPRQLTHSGEGISNLTWANQGSEIVYSSRYSGKSSLFRLPAAGGRAQLLQFAGNEAQYPVYSEHGKRLAWARNTDNTDIFQVRTKDGKATGSATSLIASTAAETSPRYSPDGKKIVFVSNRSGSDEIWVCGNGGEDPTRLTSFQGPLA
ncbi:MAG: hypothetical protein HOP19_08565, partial [Acidobacteria bacterium]|nr:hypothetical protein [Acidobacteriota bacterium]